MSGSKPVVHQVRAAPPPAPKQGSSDDLGFQFDEEISNVEAEVPFGKEKKTRSVESGHTEKQ